MLFTLPTLLYVSTGFEKIYEMRPQSYIKNLNLDFKENVKNDILDPKLDYFVDYVNLYFYVNYEKNKSYLTKKYHGLNYYEFESRFSQEEANKIVIDN